MEDIEHYISKLKSGEVKADTTNSGRDKTPVFFDDYVLLCTKADIAGQYQILAPYVNDIAEQFSSTPRILQIKVIPENISGEHKVCALSDAYILVERAKGKPLFFNGFVKADKFKVKSEANEIVQEYYDFLNRYIEELNKIGNLKETHFANYVSTAVKLIMDKEFPLGCEKSGDNIFIDEEAGLTFIDLGNKNSIENQEGNEDPVSKIIDMLLFGGKNGDCEVDLNLTIIRDGLPINQIKDFVFTIKEPLSEEFVKRVLEAYNKILLKICPFLLSNGITQQEIDDYLIKLSQRISKWKSEVKSEEQLLSEVEQVRRELLEKPIMDSPTSSEFLQNPTSRLI